MTDWKDYLYRHGLTNYILVLILPELRKHFIVIVDIGNSLNQILARWKLKTNNVVVYKEHDKRIFFKKPAKIKYSIQQWRAVHKL